MTNALAIDLLLILLGGNHEGNTADALTIAIKAIKDKDALLEALKAIRAKGYNSAYGPRATARAVLEMGVMAEDAIEKAERAS